MDFTSITISISDGWILSISSYQNRKRIMTLDSIKLWFVRLFEGRKTKAERLRVEGYATAISEIIKKTSVERLPKGPSALQVAIENAKSMKSRAGLEDEYDWGIDDGESKK